jgi:hypothetical protein
VGLVKDERHTSGTNQGSRPRFVSQQNIIELDRRSAGLESVKGTVQGLSGELLISKQTLRRAEAVQLVRVSRDNRSRTWDLHPGRLSIAGPRATRTTVFPGDRTAWSQFPWQLSRSGNSNRR